MLMLMQQLLLLLSNLPTFLEFVEVRLYHEGDSLGLLQLVFYRPHALPVMQPTMSKHNIEGNIFKDNETKFTK